VRRVPELLVAPDGLEWYFSVHDPNRHLIVYYCLDDETYLWGDAHFIRLSVLELVDIVNEKRWPQWYRTPLSRRWDLHVEEGL
jgi:hypothetical protein